MVVTNNMSQIVLRISGTGRGKIAEATNNL